MNKKLFSVAGLGALLINTFVLTTCLSQIPEAPMNAPTPTNADGRPKFWKWNNEQEWIIDNIGKDIAEMLVYAKYHADPSVKISGSALNFQTTCVDAKNNKYKFELVLPESKEPISCEFTLDGYVWSPATYQPFVKQLMNSLKLKADATSATPASYLKNLSDADMGELFTENERISKALSETPLDSNLHEQAALLQATFDMLEVAGNYSDTRWPLNRMSAHLAIAESLNDKNALTLPGQIANIALESMSCRDGVAVTKNDDLAKGQTDETVKSWLRALMIRSSGDYRIFDEKHQTQLEASQFGLRYANFLSEDKTLAYVSAHKCTPQVRWMRIAMCGEPSVESGHIVNSQMLPLELKDFADDYKLYNKQSLSSPSQLISELNKTATRCLTIENGIPKLVILSWGDVSSYHARHILDAIYAAHMFYDYTFGDKKMAAQSIKRAKDILGGMTLFPLAQMDMNEPDKDTLEQFNAGVVKLFIEHPEQIPAYVWIGPVYAAKHAASPVLLKPEPELWFAPPYPMGTAYYFVHRDGLENCKPDLNELTRLKTLCPLDEGICWEWIKKKYGKHPTGAQLREGYGKLIDYNLHVMRYCATGDYDDPVNIVKDLTKIAEFSPADYFSLGNYFAQHEQPEKARESYQNGMDKAEDSVLKANESLWLVNYLYDKGEKEKALAMAQESADVYSMGGLCCLAVLYERMGELAKAEKLYKDADERYENNDPLIGFYIRNAGKSKAYADAAASFIKKEFPAGMQHLDLAKLPAPPQAGLKITNAGSYAKQRGLQDKFIIVGLNGYRTDNKKQYNIVRRSGLDFHVKVTYWDGTKYKEAMLHTEFGFLLSVDVENYKGH